MIYLLDADVLITANRQYYPIDRVPGFWNWLIDRGIGGDVKIVEEIFDEFAGGNDDLAAWAQSDEVRAALRFNESVQIDLVRRVTQDGYAPDLRDDEVEEIGNDPFLIAYALRAPDERVVVTLEVSKPTTRRANRRIPDVCRDFGVQCVNTFAMTRELDFRI